MPVVEGKRDVDRLVKIYREAEKKIADGIKKLDPTKPFTANRKALLGELKKLERELLKQSNEWAEETVPKNHTVGSDSVIERMKKAKVPDIVTKFTKADTATINALIADTNLRFADTMSGITRTSITLLEEASKRVIVDEIAAGIGAGVGPDKIARDIAREITRGGITAFTNSAGTKVSLTTYSRMLARTTVMRARNNGAVTRLLNNGQRFGKISRHADIDGWDICNEFEGKIVDLTDPNIPLPPFHPNCRHIVQFVPPRELKTKAGTATTIRQAENFAQRNYADDVSFKGLTVTTANQINRTLETQFNNFKVTRVKRISIEKLKASLDAQYLPSLDKVVFNLDKFKNNGIALREQRQRLRELRPTSAQKNARLSELRKLLTQSRKIINDSTVSESTRQREQVAAVTIQTNIDNVLNRSIYPFYDAGDFDSVPRVIRHEFGHVAMNRNPKVLESAERIFDRGINLKNLSEFSKTNADEMMAEAYSAFTVGDKFRVPEELFPLLNRLVQ